LDAKLLFLSKSANIYAFGYLAVTLVIYSQVLGFDPTKIGAMLSLTLLGDVVLSILPTTHADRWDEKRTLIGGSVLAIFTAVIFCFTPSFWVL